MLEDICMIMWKLFSKILFDFFDRYKMKIVGCTLEYNISGPYSRPLEIRSWLQKDLRLKICHT